MTLTELSSRIGHDFGPTPWLTITQEHINGFAESTGDRQWIHTDPARAALESPYGTTIAHGFLTLSLLTQFLAQTITISDVRMGVNYGLNRVRFPAPVRSGQRVRAKVQLQSLRPFEGGLEPTFLITVECEGLEKPCCVAEWIVRYFA